MARISRLHSVHAEGSDGVDRNLLDRRALTRNAQTGFHTYLLLGSHVIRLSGASFAGHWHALPPLPSGDLRHVISVTIDIFPVLDQFVIDCLRSVRGTLSQLGNTGDRILDQIKAVQVIEDAHV